MSDCIVRFESLLCDMERALIDNDAVRVDELNKRQQVCLSDIVTQARQDETLKSELQQRMPAIHERLKRNHALLEQAITVTDSVVALLAGKSPGSREQRRGSGYRSFIA